MTSTFVCYVTLFAKKIRFVQNGCIFQIINSTGVYKNKANNIVINKISFKTIYLIYDMTDDYHNDLLDHNWTKPINHRQMRF